MPNHTTKIIAAFIMLGIVAAGTLYVHMEIGLYKDVEMPGARLDEFPVELGSWKGERGELDEGMLRSTDATEIISRCYRNLAGKEVSCHIAAFGDFWIDVPHSPLVCYPGNGWTRVKIEETDLELPDKPPATVQLVTFEKDGRRILVMFWYQLGDAIFLDNAGMGRARQRYLQSEKWPAIIKVLLQTDAFNPEQARRRLVGFATDAYAWTSELQPDEPTTATPESPQQP